MSRVAKLEDLQKRIKDTIVEGFGRRRYKDEFVRYLIFAHSSCDEAISQLNMISDIHFTKKLLERLIREYEKLGRKLNKFIQYVEMKWKT